MRARCSRSICHALFISSAALLLPMSSAQAQTPYGWIHNNHLSAYTLSAGEFEFSSDWARVNDTLDVFDFRSRLLNTTTRLGGKSGDFKGNYLDFRIGLMEGLDVFYRRSNQDLTLEILSNSQINIIDLDNKLQTETDSYGLRWVFFESVIKNPQQAWRSMALELSATENKSQDYDGLLEFVSLNDNLNVRFDPPQRFAMDRLQDDGWRARIIGTTPFNNNITLSGWLSYAEMESSSGTSFDVDLDFLRDAFLQTFDATEKQATLGVNVNWQLSPRLPVQAGYEFTHLFERKLETVSSDSSILPSFLRGSNLGQQINSNHTAWINAAYWITPNVYVGAGGKLFKNQFTGEIPHYFNPLSARFSGTLYGYAEIKLGVRFNPLGFFGD